MEWNDGIQNVGKIHRSSSLFALRSALFSSRRAVSVLPRRELFSDDLVFKRVRIERGPSDQKQGKGKGKINSIWL